MTKVTPFRMIGNIYFVGTVEASSHLIDTGDGLVLIDLDAEDVQRCLLLLGVDATPGQNFIHTGIPGKEDSRKKHTFFPAVIFRQFCHLRRGVAAGFVDVVMVGFCQLQQILPVLQKQQVPFPPLFEV